MMDQNQWKGSICGSIGGDTFASRGRLGRKSCALRQHSIASISKRFEQQYGQEFQRQPSVCSSVGGRSEAAQSVTTYKSDIYHKKRWNTKFHSFRFLVVMMGGLGLGLMLLLRYNITVAILNMVNQTAIYMHEHPNNTIEDFYNEGYTRDNEGEFDWDNEIQHMIMSWYMIAYTFPQIPCTTFGLWLGIRWAIPLQLSLCALSTILTPIMSYWGWEWLIGLRLLMGMAGAAVMPMLLCVVESWMPYNQMTLGLTCAQILQTMASAANPLVAGYLCSIHWKYAFYVPGFFTLAFCVVWVILVTNHPDENWFVSAQEVELICACDDSPDSTSTTTTNANANKNGTSDGNNKDAKIDVTEQPEAEPTWKDIFRVPCIYAYMVMWCFYCSPYSVFVFILPTYLRQFYKISVSENGFYCFIIQTGCLFSVLWPHPLLRFLNEKMGFSWTTSRRLSYLVVCSLVGATFFYVGTFHTSQLVALWLNRASHGSNDIVVTGNLMSNFAKAGLSSVAFSIMNTIGNLSVVFFSTFCGYVLDVTGQSEQGWSYIFWALAASQLVTFTIFGTCIKAGPVDFNLPKTKRETPSNETKQANLVDKDKTGSPLENNFKKA